MKTQTKVLIGAIIVCIITDTIIVVCIAIPQQGLIKGLIIWILGFFGAIGIPMLMLGYRGG